VKDWKFWSAGILGQGLMAGLFSTTRVRRERYEPIQALRAAGQPVIFTFWHGGILPLAYYHQGEGVVVLVSEHRDGEYITRVLERWGYDTARGSSTRGGSRGLRGLVKAAREGHDLAITPDGPKGPARVFKPGGIVVAQLTGLPLAPLAVGASSSWHLDSWDSFMVPKPLSKIRIVYGDPVFVPRDATDSQVEALAQQVGRTLDEIGEEAAEPLPDGVYVREDRG
jgi:lysophospholipid acyltransferase (LPLAT)-like uncharacterized protein